MLQNRCAAKEFESLYRHCIRETEHDFQDIDISGLNKYKGKKSITTYTMVP